MNIFTQQTKNFIGGGILVVGGIVIAALLTGENIRQSQKPTFTFDVKPMPVAARSAEEIVMQSACISLKFGIQTLPAIEAEALTKAKEYAQYGHIVATEAELQVLARKAATQKGCLK